MNTLQSKLMLSTRELRRVILRMPSVTGMSVSNDNGKESSLEQKIAFFTDEGEYDDTSCKNIENKGYPIYIYVWVLTLFSLLI
jgi:hypothetical protein